jgi:hypothetical protein
MFCQTLTNKKSIYVLEELKLQLLNEKMQIKLDIEKETPNDPLIAQNKM